MKQWIKVLMPMLLILGAIYGALTWMKSKTPPRPAGALKVGQSAPDFHLHRLDGSTLKVSELKSKVVMVNFWATWCAACLIEMPSIEKLYRAYRSKGLEVAAVSVDAEPQNVLPGFLRKLGLDLPVYVDQNQELSELFDVQGIPFTAILEVRNGAGGLNVLHAETGERDWNATEVREQMNLWLGVDS